MSRVASVEGTMRRPAGRAFSTPVRVAKHPVVLWELSRRVRSHLSKKRHHRSTRWRLGPETDRRMFPALLRRTAAVDLAVYHSDRGYEGMRTNLPLLWAHPRPGGVLLVDDTDAHDAFLDVAVRLSTGPIVIDKPFGARLYDLPEARAGLLRKPGRDIGA